MMKLIAVLCVHQNINSSWIFQKLAAEQLQTRASGAIRQGRRHGPAVTIQISHCWVTLLQPGGLRVGSSFLPSVPLVIREKACVFQSTRLCLPCVTMLMTDGCVHLLYIYGMEKAGGTSRTTSHLPGHSPPASQAVRRVGPTL